MTTTPIDFESTLSPGDLGFDPYVRWLEIEAPARPLSAYQLLELPLFESRPDRIRGAYERQKQRLRSNGPGPGDPAWTEIDRELSAAHDVLTDVKVRPLYDARLRRDQNRRPAPSAEQTKGAVVCTCGQSVAPGAVFCGKCGQSVWRCCPGCQTVNASAERYCSACGGDVDQLEQRLVEKTRDKLNEAERDLTENKFKKASTTLHDLALMSDHRVSAEADAAFALLQSIQEREQAAAGALNNACDAAEEAIRGGEYQHALELLDSVPAGMRNDRFRALQNRCQARIAEIEDLENEISDHLSAKDYGRLGETLQRLHELNPHHGKSQKLAADLAVRFQRKAKESLKAGKGATALTLLRTIPPFVQDEQWQKLEKAARLQSLLMNEVQQTQLVTKEWVALGQKIVEALPGSETVASIVGEISQHATAGGVGTFFPKGQPASRIQLDFLGGFPGFEVAADVEPVLAAHLGEFAVAAGVALMHFPPYGQGVNLCPKRKSWNVFSKKKSGEVIGIDIGHSSAKWIHLSKEDDKIAVRGAEIHPLTAEGEKERIEEAQGALSEFLSERSGAAVALAIPPTVTMLKNVSLPTMDAKKIASAMELELPRQFPIDPEELYCHYVAIEPAEGKTMQTIQCAAVRKRHVDPYLTAVQQCKMTVDYVQDDSSALANLVRAVTQGAADARQWLLVHCGAESTHLVYNSPQGLKTRHVPFSARALNQALAHTFRLTHEQADLVRRQPTRSKNPAALLSCLSDAFGDLESDMARTMEIWRRELERPIELQHCFFSGGAIRTVCLAGRVARILNREA